MEQGTISRTRSLEQRRCGVPNEPERSVTRSVRYAIARIDEHHRSLGSHLARAVDTGTYLRLPT